MPTLSCASVDPARFVKPSPEIFVLDHAVHVWKFPLMDIAHVLLSESEMERLARLRQEDDRLRFKTGRQMLRLLSSKYLSLSPREIRISAERNQKPSIINKTNFDFHFSLSHSGKFVLIACSDSEVGADLEEINRSFSFYEIIKDQFSEAERNFVRCSPDPAYSFYTLWTRKEAFLKARGSGLTNDLKNLPCLDGEHALPGEQLSWELNSFRMEDRYQAAIAFPEQIRTVGYFDGGDLLYSKTPYLPD